MPRPSPDLAACRALLRNGSRSFFAASFFLPRAYRDPATALYAFCRLADDAIDGAGSDHRAALAALHRRLDRVYAGDPSDDPVERAFARVVRDHALPRALPEALLEGFLWDAEGRQYDTVENLEDYAARVAGSVGAMMTVLMGVRDPAVIARAADLGVAMQLTNIARDVGEDARQGRLYLPRVWLAEAEIDPDAWLAAPAFGPGLSAVVARLLDRADRHYRRAAGGIAALPAGCRPGIHAARLLYAEIGAAVAANGYDSLARRAVVSPSRKLWLLGGALAAATAGPASFRSPPVLAANRFLVRAVRPLPEPVARMPAWWNLPARFSRVVDLFERLEQLERQGTQGARVSPAGEG